MESKQTIAQQLNWDFEVNGYLEIKDKNDKRIYYENQEFWEKYEYHSQGLCIYYENSYGEITNDSIPAIIEHNGHKYQLIL